MEQQSTGYTTHDAGKAHKQIPATPVKGSNEATGGPESPMVNKTQINGGMGDDHVPKGEKNFRY